MTPDFEKRLNEELDKASAKDVIQGFDYEQEWAHLAAKLPLSEKRIALRPWAVAAAILLLLTTGYFSWHFSNDTIPAVASANNGPKDSGLPTSTKSDSDVTNKEKTLGPLDQNIQAANNSGKLAARTTGNIACRTANDVIHNGTPCPLEVRISQTMKCPNIKPEAISSSSTLQPEQSAQLNYKEKNNKERNCSLTINEIEIKSIATGEVILLNSSSSPSMQEVFCYLTGEKEGNILAGVFNNDCDKKNRKHNLRLDNRDGKLILE